MAVVPPETSTEALADLKGRGIVGVSFNLPLLPPGYYERSEPLLDRLRSLDMFLQVQVEGDRLLEILPVIEAHGVKLLFDHCGRPVPDRGLDQPSFQALLALGRRRRAAVKLSGFNKFSAASHPFADTWRYVAALIDAFGLEACVWGSDWPFLRARERVDYGPLLQMIGDLLPDAAVRRAILSETPRRLFGFGGAI